MRFKRYLEDHGYDTSFFVGESLVEQTKSTAFKLDTCIRSAP